MFKQITIIGVLLATLVATGEASAQTPPNRRVMAVSVQAPEGGPAGGSTSIKTVRAFVTAEAEPVAGPVDLSMVVEFRRNGTAVAQQTILAEANLPGPGGGPCGEFPCELGEVCYCHGFPPECECGYWIGTAEENIPCTPGDEIMVILYPAPGAVPESDTSDDAKLTTYEGSSVFWNRRVERVQAVPSQGAGGPASAGDSFFDVFVDLSAAAQYDGDLSLGSTLELWIDGVHAATTNVPAVADTITWSACTPSIDCDIAICNDADDGGGLCTDSADYPTCVCYYQLAHVPAFVDVPADPDAQLKVLLRPVPGALPELPGFPDDDEDEIPVCPGDTNGDGIIGIDDVVNVVLDFGTDGALHGGDVDGSGFVDIDDVVFVVLKFGTNCNPPV